MAANSQEALQQLQQFQSSRANPLDIYSKATQDLGVGDVRGRVTGLRNTLLNTENLLNQVEGSVTGRTQGSLVTEAQRQRLANLERQPLAAQYGQQSKGLANEQATLSDLLNQAQQRSSMEFQGLQTKEQSLRDVYNSMFQREQEQRRREEADRAFAEQQRQADRAFAEQQRQYNASLQLQREAAARARASASASSLSSGGGSTDWVRLVREAQQRADGDKGWGATYAYLRSQLGYDFAPRGSAADQAFHAVFGR